MRKMTGPGRSEAIEALSEALEGWIEQGTTEQDALERLAWALDAALDLEAIGAALGVPWNVLGAHLETVDDRAALAALQALQRIVKGLAPDPDRLRQRADRAEAKGRPRLAARRRQRAARIEARAGGG